MRARESVSHIGLFPVVSVHLQVIPTNGTIDPLLCGAEAWLWECPGHDSVYCSDELNNI